MIDSVLISFAFGAGIAAFFSPCSVSLLPGFISYYLSRKTNTSTQGNRIIEGFSFGFLTIIGFFLVFGLSGGLVIYFGQKIKVFIPSLGIITGILLFILGISILAGKDLMLKLPKVFHIKKDSSPVLFGIFYAIGALGCTFPLFLTILLQGINDSSLIGGLSSLFSYIAGMSILMLITTIGIVIARDIIQKRIMQITPYIKKISAVIIIFAGIYMVYINLMYTF